MEVKLKPLFSDDDNNDDDRDIERFDSTRLQRDMVDNGSKRIKFCPNTKWTSQGFGDTQHDLNIPISLSKTLPKLKSNQKQNYRRYSPYKKEDKHFEKSSFTNEYDKLVNFSLSISNDKKRNSSS